MTDTPISDAIADLRQQRAELLDGLISMRQRFGWDHRLTHQQERCLKDVDDEIDWLTLELQYPRKRA